VKELAAAAAYGTFLSRSGSALSRSSVRSGAAPSAACSSLAGAAPSTGAARPRPAALSTAAQLVRRRSSIRRRSSSAGAAPSAAAQLRRSSARVRTIYESKLLEHDPERHLACLLPCLARTAFTNKDCGKGEREAQWAVDQRALHGLNQLATSSFSDLLVCSSVRASRRRPQHQDEPPLCLLCHVYIYLHHNIYSIYMVDQAI